MLLITKGLTEKRTHLNEKNFSFIEILIQMCYEPEKLTLSKELMRHYKRCEDKHHDFFIKILYRTWFLPQKLSTAFVSFTIYMIFIECTRNWNRLNFNQCIWIVRGKIDFAFTIGLSIWMKDCINIGLSNELPQVIDCWAQIFKKTHLNEMYV